MSEEIFNENTMPAEELFEVLLRPKYRQLNELWLKALDRVTLDHPGAITAATTLLEATCKLILSHFDVPIKSSFDLPKLFYLVTLELNISSDKKTEIWAKKFFGSVSTNVGVICELRNKKADAHFDENFEFGFSSPLAEAQLAVNLAGTTVLYLLSCFDSYMISQERVTAEGNLILKFEKSLVWRLVDHSRNAPRQMDYYGQKVTEPGLFLVGNTGIYLISNGTPRIDHTGIIKKVSDEPFLNLCAWADGYDHKHANFDNVQKLHNSVAEGSDFSIFIETSLLIEPLVAAVSEIIIVLYLNNEDFYEIEVYPDIAEHQIRTRR